MLQRVRIQILDTPVEEIIFDAAELEWPEKNKTIAENLRNEMTDYYPTLVSVEYVDLFNEDIAFPEIRELLSRGAITTPVVLINGVPKIHGGIPRTVIMQEVERLLSSGPVH